MLLVFAAHYLILVAGHVTVALSFSPNTSVAALMISTDHTVKISVWSLLTTFQDVLCTQLFFFLDIRAPVQKGVTTTVYEVEYMGNMWTFGYNHGVDSGFALTKSDLCDRNTNANIRGHSSLWAGLKCQRGRPFQTDVPMSQNTDGLKPGHAERPMSHVDLTYSPSGQTFVQGSLLSTTGTFFSLRKIVLSIVFSPILIRTR